MIDAPRNQFSGMASYIRRFPEVAAKAQTLAANDTIRWAKTRSTEAIQGELNVPKAALAGKRFDITQYATPNRPEAVLSAEFSPLNLARFSTVKPGQGVKPRIQVTPGGAVPDLSHSFYIPGPSGGFGLAVRTKGAMTNSRKARQIGKNLYILFGPSVDQAFRTSMPTLVPQVMDQFESNFYRQFARLNRG